MYYVDYSVAAGGAEDLSIKSGEKALPTIVPIVPNRNIIILFVNAPVLPIKENAPHPVPTTNPINTLKS